MSKLKKIMVKSGTIGQEGTFTDLIFSTPAYNIDYITGENVQQALDNRVKIFKCDNMNGNSDKIFRLGIGSDNWVVNGDEVYPPSLIRFMKIGKIDSTYDSAYNGTFPCVGTLSRLPSTSSNFVFLENLGSQTQGGPIAPQQTNGGNVGISLVHKPEFSGDILKLNVSVKRYQCFIMEYQDSNDGFWIDTFEEGAWTSSNSNS